MADAWQSLKDWKHTRESLRLRSIKVEKEDAAIRAYVKAREREQPKRG